MRKDVMSMFRAVLIAIVAGALCPVSAAEDVPRLISAPDVIPPATAAMHEPGFWLERIDGDPDAVIMTLDQIEALNRRNRSRPLETTDVFGNPYSLSGLGGRHYHNLQFHGIDPLAMTAVSGDSLRDGIMQGYAYARDRELWDRRHIPLPDLIRGEILDAFDIDAIPGTVSPRPAIVVRRTDLRRVPSDVRVYSPQYMYLDYFQQGSLLTGMPAAILHVSRDRDWCYVRSEFNHGWVRSEDLAVGEPRLMRTMSEPGDFVVAVGHKVPVFADEACTVWLSDLYLGARVGLTGMSGGTYGVTVPVRTANGALGSARGYIRRDDAVSVGYQPFTQRNVLTTMFSLLGRPYGWINSCNERDCCGIIRAVFLTFGFHLPRGTTHQLHSTDHVMAFPADTAKDEKYRLLDKGEAGITLCGFGGHIVMYLGKVDGVHYVIHSNGYSYHEPDGTEVRIGRVSVTDTEIEGGSEIVKFTEISTFRP